jgi:hypothetical protein
MPAVNYDLVDYSTYKLFFKNITHIKISAPEIRDVNSDVNRTRTEKIIFRKVICRYLRSYQFTISGNNKEPDLLTPPHTCALTKSVHESNRIGLLLLTLSIFNKTTSFCGRSLCLCQQCFNTGSYPKMEHAQTCPIPDVVTLMTQSLMTQQPASPPDVSP